MSVGRKICVCVCCSIPACWVSCCMNEWAGIESCGKACLHCYACFWTILAPISHSYKLGDCGKGFEECVTALKYCVNSLALDFIGPVDGVINCALYNNDNCSSGVSGMKDMQKHGMYIGKRVTECLKLERPKEPFHTFDKFDP